MIRRKISLQFTCFALFFTLLMQPKWVNSEPIESTSQPINQKNKVTNTSPTTPTHLLSSTGKLRISEKKEAKGVNLGLGKAPKEMDRSSPFAAWSSFIKNCKARRWDLATHIFNLGDIAQKDQLTLGASRAQKLCEVLDQTNQLTIDKDLPKSTVGPIVNDAPSNYVVVARISIEGKKEEAWLRRTSLADGREIWLLTRRSLAQVGTWYSFIVKGAGTKDVAEIINIGLGQIPNDLKLNSPREAAESFAKLIREGNYRRAAHLLNLSQIKTKKQSQIGSRLVRRLAFVLMRLRPGFAGELSNDPPGAPERDVPDDEEQVLSTKLVDQPTSIRLGRYYRKNKSPVWLFSRATVAKINPLYQAYGPGWAGDYLPPLFFNVQFFSIQLWQWIGLIIGLILAFIFGRIAAYFLRKALLKAARFTSWDWDDELVSATRGPLTTLLACFGFIIALGFLALPDQPEKLVYGIIKVVAILSTGWFITRAFDVAGAVALQFFQERNDEVGMAMVPVARKIIKPIIFLFILIVALQNVGINVAGLLAGLGIGGLALAMASKSTLENMLGGITIAFDRPFKVGDFIKVGDLMGSVEEVGLRSTRVRTLDRTVVTVPNGQMADSKVENFAKRDRIRLLFSIGLQYDSSLDQMKLVIDDIKRMILSEPKAIHDGFRVRFDGFGDSALQIQIYVFINTTDYNEFTAIREDLLMKIAKIVENAGVEFAFPTQTIYQGKASNADHKKADLARKEVQKRIDAGELSIPEIPEELRQKLEVVKDS